MRGRQTGERRQLAVERLEARQMLSLTHLYTFNDGSANDWIGNAHGTLVNGASIVAGQLVLTNAGVTSGQSGTVQHVRLPAGVLPGSGSTTVSAWFTTTAAADWTRVFDFGDQSGAAGNSYLFFTPQSSFGDARGAIRPAGQPERIASSAPLDDGVPHLASVVVDAQTGFLQLFVDGNLVDSEPLAGVDVGVVNDALGYLGRSLFNADAGFTGSIDEVRIYDEARTAEQLAADAAAGPSTLASSPLSRQLEYLDRGVVAVRRSPTQVYVGWRLLGTDPADVAFNVYRQIGSGTPVKINAVPLTATTDLNDAPPSFASGLTYSVRPVIEGIELAAGGTFALSANAATQQYLNVPLQIPAGGTTPSGEAYTYAANDASVGDLDGDGQYEIVLKWDPSNAKDNSQSGYTGNVYIDAYRLDGTRLWRIDLGRNVRAGAHYTQFLVYDFDGDGRSEVVMRTAPGTIDGAGQPVLLGADQVTADYRNASGYILTGPEYLTVFNGETGAAMATVPFAPARGSVSAWGDSYGNRVDRFLATVAYLDGVRPSLVMTRGYYEKTMLAAYDWRDGQLTQRWLFDSTASSGNAAYEGQGTHNISVGDVDLDGKDEIIFGAAAFNDDGTGLYSTGLGHGDALHLSDMVPSRPGLEVFQAHESPGSYGTLGATLRDARTGEVLAGAPANNDVGRGVALDIDPNSPGFEFWAANSDPSGEPRKIYAADGAPLYDTPSNMFYNFGVYWDADRQSELLDGTTISNWNNPGRSNFDLDPGTGGTQQFAPNGSSNNGSKSTPSLAADVLGDWREEVIWRRSDNTALMIFTTIIGASSRNVTLMHDPQYRMAIAWQNVAYNQPPHVSYDMTAGAPSSLQAFVASASPLAGDFNGDQRVDALDRALWEDRVGQTAIAGRQVGDADGDLDVDGADLLVWQQNLGAPILVGSGGSAFSSAVRGSTADVADQSAALAREGAVAEAFAALGGHTGGETGGFAGPLARGAYRAVKRTWRSV